MYNRLGAEEVAATAQRRRLASQILCQMQQLLGDKATSIHHSFLQEIFLQCLPANVCIVLVSTSNTSTLEKVAQLADKIIVAAVHTSADVEQLEVSQLSNKVESLTKRKISRGRSPSPHPQSSSTLCWYHKRFGNDAYKCRPHVPNRQTTRPVASGDEHWPITKSPVLYYVTDRHSGLRFLVDTGAEASVIPASGTEHKHCQEHSGLQVVNGTPIATYGS